MKVYLKHGILLWICPLANGNQKFSMWLKDFKSWISFQNESLTAWEDIYYPRWVGESEWAQNNLGLETHETFIALLHFSPKQSKSTSYVEVFNFIYSYLSIIIYLSIIYHLSIYLYIYLFFCLFYYFFHFHLFLKFFKIFIVSN